MFPIGASYAPYWRGQYVPQSEWEKDLRNMQALGFSYVSIFTPWQHIERVKGVYDLSEQEKILALAAKLGLKVSIGLGVHRSFSLYPPRWLMDEYRGVGMLDKNGKPTVSGSYRLPCFEDPWYRNYAEKYLAAVAGRLAGAQALAQWRVWGEASLFDLCYCPIHLEKFRAFLRGKYGSLEKLNPAWNSEGPSSFKAWEQISPPLDAYHFYGYTPWLDWQEFLDSSLTDAVAWVNRIVKDADPKHPTLIELWMPTTNSSGGGDDVWRMAEAADQLGHSIYNKPVKNYAQEMDMMRSAAEFNSKDAWAVEVQGAPRLFGWNHPGTPGADELAMWMWELIAHGAKGVFFWTFRARLSDIEGGEFGMLRRDGSIPGRTLKLAAEFQVANQCAELLLHSRSQARVAIYWSREAEHLAKIDKVDNEEICAYLHSVHSAYEFLWQAGIPADFINTGKLSPAALKPYPLLLMPFAFCMNAELAGILKEYVRNGGKIIADFMCGSKDFRGHCADCLPGFGLDELFGVAEDELLAAKNDTLSLSAGGNVQAFEFIQTLRLRGAEAFGFLPDGSPVFARNKYGKGETVFTGTMLFHRLAWQERKANRDFMLQLIKSCGVVPPVEFSAPADSAPEAVLKELDGHKQILILLNHAKEEFRGGARIISAAKKVTDLRSGKIVAAARNGAHLEIPGLSLPAIKAGLYLLEP